MLNQDSAVYEEDSDYGLVEATVKMTQSIAAENSAPFYMCELYPKYSLFSDEDGDEQVELPEWLGSYTKEAKSRDFELRFNNYKNGEVFERDYWF